MKTWKATFAETEASPQKVSRLSTMPMRSDFWSPYKFKIKKFHEIQILLYAVSYFLYWDYLVRCKQDRVIRYELVEASIKLGDDWLIQS